LQRNSLVSIGTEFENVDFFLSQSAFLNALEHSNPEFFQRLMQAKQAGKDLSPFLFSLQKFFVRAMSHSTPRHLWSGFEFLQGDLKKDRVLCFENSRSFSGTFYLNPSLEISKDRLSGWSEHKDGEFSRFVHQLTPTGSKLFSLFIQRNLGAPRSLNSFFVPKGFGERSEFLAWCQKSGLIRALINGESGLQVYSRSDYKKNQGALNRDLSLEFAPSPESREAAENLLAKHRNELNRALSLYFELKDFDQHQIQLRFIAAKFKERFESGGTSFETFTRWLTEFRSTATFQTFRNSVHESFMIAFSALRNSKSAIRIDEIQNQLISGLRQDRPAETQSKRNHLNCLVLREWGDKHVYLKYVGGSLASTTFSRQAKVNSELLKFAEVLNVQQQALSLEPFYLLDYQSANNTNANIMDVPSPGLNRRLCVNTAKGEGDLGLADVDVELIGGRFALIDRRTKAEFLLKQSSLLDLYSSRNPYLSSLAWLSYQDDFPLGSFDRIFFPAEMQYPRVELGNVVLVPRRWTFEDPEIVKSHRELEKYLGRYDLPDQAFLRVKDSNLLIDFRSPEQCRFAHRILKSNDRAFFEECPPASHDGPRYFSDFFYPFKLEVPTQHLRRQVSKTDDYSLNARRESPRFFYVLLYMDPAHFNSFLRNQYQRFVRDLKRRNLKSNSFFVRYSEGGWHLRLRFQMRGKGGEAIRSMASKWVERLYIDGEISRYEIKPYEPELTRYGGRQATVLFESHSWVQSRAVLDFFELQQKTESTPKDKEAFVLLLWFVYLKTFFSDDSSVTTFVARNAYQERRPDVVIEKAEREEIYRALERLNKNVKIRSLVSWFSLEVDKYHRSLQKLQNKKKLQAPVDSICRSVMHMLCNRIDEMMYRRESELFRVCLSGLKAKTFKKLL